MLEMRIQIHVSYQPMPATQPNGAPDYGFLTDQGSFRSIVTGYSYDLHIQKEDINRHVSRRARSSVRT
jgi:hypothetical protein